MSSVFRDIQLDIAAKLADAPYFWENGIEVVSPVQKDVQSKVSEALAKLGLCAIVAVPSAGSKFPDAQTFFDNVEVVVLCVENRIINATPLITAEEMAEVVACWLQHYQTQGLHEALACERIEDVFPSKEDTSLDVRQVSVSFKTSVCLSYVVTTTAAPSISQGGGKITITGAAGATLRYTVDGTTPSVDSTAYTVAFTSPSAGTVVKSRAFKSGQGVSSTTSYTVT